MPLTSKSRLAEQAQRVILGGTPTADAEVKSAEIILYIEQCFASIVKMNYFAGKAEGESTINGDFIYDFDNVDIVKDANKDMFYSKVPASTISLPYDIGFYHVSLQKDQRNAFVRVPNGFNSLYRDLPSARLEGRMGYFVERNRIYYVNMSNADNPEKALIKLVAPLGSVDDDDEVNIPLDVQHQIVEKSVQMFMAEQAAPKDTENDNFK
jgi:hypothetical protein